VTVKITKDIACPTYEQFPNSPPIQIGLVSCLLPAFSLKLATITTGFVLLAVGFILRRLVRQADSK
jgi:hypothetical protein